MTGGHYVAYVRLTDGTWAYASDTSVSAVPVQSVLQAQAYLLFYKRET